MTAPRRTPIRTESIELGALLKWIGAAPTGGAAKRLIQQGGVVVNGEVERRRSRLVHTGDRIEVSGRTFVIERATVP